MALKTIQPEDYKKYLARANLGEWTRELKLLGITHVDIWRNYIYFDERKTGAVRMNPKRTKFLDAWNQIERLAEVYSRNSNRTAPKWWNHKDWEFCSDEE